jgi:hypothetical protein
MNTGPSTVFIGPSAWVPGSRAAPAPRNDDHLELDGPNFRGSLLRRHLRRGVLSAATDAAGFHEASGVNQMIRRHR